MVVFQILLSWSPLKVALPEMYDAIKVQGERCIESNKFEEHARDRASPFVCVESGDDIDRRVKLEKRKNKQSS